MLIYYDSKKFNKLNLLNLIVIYINVKQCRVHIFIPGFYNHKVSFLLFSDNLFNLNQILSAFNSTLIVCSISNIDLPDTNMFVSSANNMIKLDLHAVCLSFTYNTNNRGPKIDPCGTPQLILSISDLTPLYT